MTSSIGPYRVLEPIGVGGIGQVFAAIHEHLGRRVALKVLSPTSANNPEIVARFLQEGRALEQLKHRGVVRVYDCGKLEDGTAYLAMEHIEGDTLDVWARKQGAPVSLDTALAIAGQIADAMLAVHAKGIIHRDLKPSNIIISPDSAAPLGWRATVVDFGIAKVPPIEAGGDTYTQVQTAEHNVLGTAAYMAPEQCTNATDVTVQADVYALGLILFELIAGRPVFSANDSVGLLFHQVKTQPPSLCALVSSAPPLLGAFVASMLAKEPEARPTMSRCLEMLHRPWGSSTGECPFPGLRPFSDAEAELFFGRESEVRNALKLLQAMREDSERRWLRIEGISGAGKSSLVQAGILPQLSLPSWIVAAFRPSEDPLHRMAQALAAAYEMCEPAPSAAEIESALRSDEGSLLDVIALHHPPSATLLLVIEQLEELFTLGGPAIARIDRLLSDALSSPASPVRLLTTLRSDYFHRLEQAPRMARLLNSQSLPYHLAQMQEEALARVIRGMAARAGLELSAGLPERMVRDAASADGQLPLLGHTLRSMWLTRSGAELTTEDYEQLGGVSGALTRQVTQLLERLGEDGRDRAKWLILDLVQVGRGVPDTRRPRARADVLAAAGGDAKAEEVLARLSAARHTPADTAEEPLRLVVISGDGDEPAQQRVDLVHEALLQRVPVIAGWIEAERALLERHADLEVAAHAWDRAGSPSEGLPFGSLLDHYRGGAVDGLRRARLARMASERARRFLDFSESLDRRRRRWRRFWAFALALAAVITSISALRAGRDSRRAQESRERFIETTDEFVSSADWTLSRLAYTVDIRKKLLGKIEDDLTKSLDDDSPAIRRALIEAKHRRSDLARLNETLGAASALIADAHGRIEAERKDKPSDPDLRELLALNLSKRGKILLARGDSAKARADFEASVNLLIAISNTKDANGQRTLATSLRELADAEIALEHFDVAEELYGKAVQRMSDAAKAEAGSDNDDYNKALVASTRVLQADAARRSGDPGAASVLLPETIKTLERIVQDHPGDLLYHLFLGRAHRALAVLRFEQQDASDADRLYGLAIKFGEELHRVDSTQKDYGLHLCESLRGVESTASVLGDDQRSRDARKRRCQIERHFRAQDPEDLRFRHVDCP